MKNKANKDRLFLYHMYSRKDVHDVFSPLSPFWPYVGKWGINGVVRIEPEKDNFVFFVRIGSGSKYSAGQSISKDGVLKWFAPMSQTRGSPLIQILKNHRSERNNIYLLAKFGNDGKYVYLGTLEYKSLSPDQVRPLEFEWKLVSWPPPESIKNLYALQGREQHS